MAGEDEDFVCAICEYTISMRWNMPGSGRTIPPICRVCESRYGPTSANLDGAGTFLDRRLVRQGLALAIALDSHARFRFWQETGHAAP